MSAADHRTVKELLAESDALARETLLDATLEHAPAMVKSWNHLVGSAAELWAVLVPAPASPSGSDPMEGCGRSERRSAVASPPATTPMNCIELVAHRLSTPLIRPSLLRSRSAGAGVHTAKGQRSRVSQGATSVRNSATTLSGRALYTVPEAINMLNLSQRVIYKQIRSGRLLTVTKERRRLVQASSMTAYVDLLVKKRWLGPMPTRRTRGEGSLDWDESRQRWMAAVDVGFRPTRRFLSPQKAILLPAGFWL